LGWAELEAHGKTKEWIDIVGGSSDTDIDPSIELNVF
jgi:hypothetical protein